MTLAEQSEATFTQAVNHWKLATYFTTFPFTQLRQNHWKRCSIHAGQ